MAGSSPGRRHSSDPLLSEQLPKGGALVGSATLSVLLYILLLCVTLGFTAIVVTTEVRRTAAWQEFRPVLQLVTPVSCEPQDDHDELLVHVDCPLRRLRTFHPPAEFKWNLDRFRGIFYEVKVEMFQWQAAHGTLGMYVKGAWTDKLVGNDELPSSLLGDPKYSYKNPEYFPSVPGHGRQFTPYVYAGGYRVGSSHLRDFHKKRRLSVRDDGVYRPSAVRPPLTLTSENTHVQNNYIFSGSPENPEVGDVRISVYGNAATHVSAIGVQRRHLESNWGSTKELVGWPSNSAYRPANSTTMLVREGDFMPYDLVWQSVQEGLPPQGFRWTGISIMTGTMGLFLSSTMRLSERFRRGGGWLAYAMAPALCAGGVTAVGGGLFKCVESYLSGLLTIAGGVAVLVAGAALGAMGFVSPSDDEWSPVASPSRDTDSSKTSPQFKSEKGYSPSESQRILQPAFQTEHVLGRSQPSSIQGSHQYSAYDMRKNVLYAAV